MDIGGEGYFQISTIFQNNSNINFHIVDYENCLIGKEFSKKVDQDFNLNFYDDLSSMPKFDIDIIFCSSSIQFIYEYETFIIDLLRVLEIPYNDTSAGWKF